MQDPILTIIQQSEQTQMKFSSLFNFQRFSIILTEEFRIKLKVTHL